MIVSAPVCLQSDKHSAEVCSGQAMALRDFALRNNQDKDEQSVGSGFSVSGASRSSLLHGPSRRNWGCCLCPKPCRS